MADVKVCDRCGKRLADERMTFNVKPVNKSFKLRTTLFKPNEYWSTDRLIYKEHDLCMDCVKKLSDWMQSADMEAATHD